MSKLDPISKPINKDHSFPIHRQCMPIVFVTDIFSSHDTVHDYTKS